MDFILIRRRETMKKIVFEIIQVVIAYIIPPPIKPLNHPCLKAMMYNGNIERLIEPPVAPRGILQN